MDELVRSFHIHLSRRNYDEMESVWLELLESAVQFERLAELVEAAGKHGLDGRASLLWSVLASSLGEKGRYAEQLLALRRQAALMPDSAPLAAEISKCLQRLCKDVPDLEQLLHKSGVGYGQSLKDALPRLDRYLSLQSGKPVLDGDRGPGRVKKLDLLLDRVTVDFDIGAMLTWDISAAARRLRIPVADGYFARLVTDRAGLVKLAADSPGTVIGLYLRDVGKPASVKDLQDGLTRLVSQSGWEPFWNRARREIAKNAHILARTTPGRTYQWIDVPVEAPAEPSVKGERALKRRVAAAELVGVGTDRVLDEFQKLQTFPERKHFVETLISARPGDADAALAALFRTGVDARVRALIERELSTRNPALWQTTYEGALTGYRQNPDAFIWLAEHSGRKVVSAAKGVLSRMLDLLESDLHKPHWIRLRKALVASDYSLLREVLVGTGEPEAVRLAARLKRVRLLEGYRADEMVALLAERFPVLRAADDEDTVYTTATGLDKAKQELKRITDVEIPKSAEEIARARAHGDLSENYEYKAAKEKQARLMARMKSLREDVARSRVVSAADVDTTEVSFGCRVRLTDSDGEESTYTIFGPWDADPDSGIISSGSPLALVLLGKKPGETLETGGRRLTVAAVELAL